MPNYIKAIEDLKEGKETQFRPRGNSMNPKIKSGQLITLISVNIEDVLEGDIVFCKVKGSYYVHLVSAVAKDKIQISNNKGHVNGWISKNNLYGKVIKVEE